MIQNISCLAVNIYIRRVLTCETGNRSFVVYSIVDMLGLSSESLKTVIFRWN